MNIKIHIMLPDEAQKEAVTKELDPHNWIELVTDQANAHVIVCDWDVPDPDTEKRYFQYQGDPKKLLNEMKDFHTSRQVYF